MEYFDHYQWHDMINVPSKAHAMGCEWCKVWVVKILHHNIKAERKNAEHSVNSWTAKLYSLK